MPHKFDPEHVSRLDDPRRREMLPPERILHAFGLREGMTLVDLGCGTGFFALPAAEIVGTAGHVYGIDLQPAMVDVCRRRAAEAGAGNLTVLQGEEVAIPLPDGTADAVLLANVLHEMRDPHASLREIARILKPAGALWLVEWKKAEMPAGPPIHERLAPADAERLLNAAGFTVERFPDDLPTHYLLIAVKAR